MAEERVLRHDRMGYSVANPSNEEAVLVAVEEAGLATPFAVKTSKWTC
jgi:hypothetical protein